MPDDYGQNFFTSPVLTAPLPNTRRWAMFGATGGGVFSQLNDGYAAGGTHANLLISATDPAYVMTTMATGAVLNNQAFINANTIWRWASRMKWQAVVRPGASIAVERIWAGLSSVTSATLLGLDTPGTSGHNVAAFRYSTAVPDTNWQAVCSNGSSQTIVDTGIAVAASASRKLEIRWDLTQALFFIDGVLKATIAATLPLSTAFARQMAGVQTLEAVDKSLAVGWLYNESE